MTVNGTFDVNLDAQNDETASAGRMVISKEYFGGLVGLGAGQMISKRTDGGSAVYFAIEEFSGALDGKSGSFTLAHSGEMSAAGQSLEVKIIQGSGTDELKGISGTLEIIQEDGKHKYVLNYVNGDDL